MKINFQASTMYWFIIQIVMILVCYASAQEKKLHIADIQAKCESLSSCKYSFTVIGNSIPRYPGFQARCSAQVPPGDTTFRACQIGTTSDTLRAGGVSAVKSVDGYVNVGGEDGGGDVTVSVTFDVGERKSESWEGGKVVEKEELEGGRRGFDVDVKMVETELA